jgi:gliding motility-associated-like protein
MEINWTPQDYLDCPTCLQPLVSPVSSMDYTIYVKDIHGCLANATTHIFLNTKGGIFIPSAFSPGNADEINDRFTVFAREGLVRNIDYLEVFDRWGNQVFMARDFLPNDESQGWDGSFRSQEIIPGVFVYSTMIELVNGEKVRLYGEVTLYR